MLDNQLTAFLLGSMAAQRGAPNLHRHDVEFKKLVAREYIDKHGPTEEWHAKSDIPDHSNLWREWAAGWQAHMDFLRDNSENS
jgi:hypothetical protein